MNRDVLLMVLLVWTVPLLGAPPDDARAKFIEHFGAQFRGNAIPADVVEAQSDFRRAKGEATWRVALPVDDDDRVRFLDVVIRDGKFVRGTMATFGVQEEKISASRFAELRRESIMIARRAGVLRLVHREGRTPRPEVAVYAPTARPMIYKAPLHPVRIQVDPCGRLLGYSRKIFDKLSVDLTTLRYDVVLSGPEGISVPLGICTVKKGFQESDVVKAIRSAVEEKHPERIGAVSDRDVADFYSMSTIVCKGSLK